MASRCIPLTTTLFRHNGSTKSIPVAQAHQIRVTDRYRIASTPMLTFLATFHDYSTSFGDIQPTISIRSNTDGDRHKIRDCRIYYYLEDNTIKVVEPPLLNSRMRQGTLINRNKIQKPNGGYYTLDDLNVGVTVIFYSKIFKIYDCEDFTRNFMVEIGYRVGVPQPNPVDPVYAERMEQDKPHCGVRKPIYKKDTRGDFVKYFPQLLHFHCIYERGSTLLDQKKVSMYYSLGRSTMFIVDDELKDEHRKTLDPRGRTDSVMILNPRSVPKPDQPTKGLFSEEYGEPILNRTSSVKRTTFQHLMSAGDDCGFVIDRNSKTGRLMKEYYYTPDDFDLGVTLRVFGAKLFIYDCDDFTRRFYETEFGRELKPVKMPMAKIPMRNHIVCPKEFGETADTMVSCKKLYPADRDDKRVSVTFPPTNESSQCRKLMNFYLNSRDGVDGKILAFLATNYSKSRYNTYLFSYFLEDDTVELRELDSKSLNKTTSSTNKILHRMRLAKPTLYSQRNTDHSFYGVRDLFVGCTITVSTSQYVLCDADEYTLDYMERNCETFPFSDSCSLLQKYMKLADGKVSDLLKSFESADRQSNGFVDFDSFRETVKRLIVQDPCTTPEQEYITLARTAAQDKEFGPKIQEVVSRIQDRLKKQLFQDFGKLRTQFQTFEQMYGNAATPGRFVPYQVFRILVSCPLPVERDLLMTFVYALPTCEGLVDYNMAVNYLDYFKNPAETPDHSPYAVRLRWCRVETIKNIDKIDYLKFLKSITYGDV